MNWQFIRMLFNSIQWNSLYLPLYFWLHYWFCAASSTLSIASPWVELDPRGGTQATQGPDWCNNLLLSYDYSQQQTNFHISTQYFTFSLRAYTKIPNIILKMPLFVKVQSLRVEDKKSLIGPRKKRQVALFSAIIWNYARYQFHQIKKTKEFKIEQNAMGTFRVKK